MCEWANKAQVYKKENYLLYNNTLGGLCAQYIG